MAWYDRGYGYGGFAPYVPVANRRANALKHAKKVAKKRGCECAPVTIKGRAMATTFWGKAWCDHVEEYCDYASRLPRGRTYARNGSVVDLQIKPGKIEAIVAGSEVYTVTITISTLPKKSWARLKAECSQSIASLIDLLTGRFDAGVMERLVHPKDGLFPSSKEIKMDCTCPDSAGLCKHVAAVFYGIGNRLDNCPELLFTLRNVDHLELVGHAVAEDNLERSLSAGDDSLAGGNLSEIFGIELDDGNARPKKASRAKKAVKAKPPIEKPKARKKRATAK